MFLRFYKRFRLKKIVKKSFSESQRQISEIKIKSVALLVDGNSIKATHEFIGLIENQSLNVKAFVLTKDKKAENTEKITYFLSSDIDADGRIKNADLKGKFLNSYDLLINYYEESITELLYLSSISKAGFRAGFKQGQIILNDLMIDVDMSEYPTFVDELFKYLKNFNKI